MRANSAILTLSILFVACGDAGDGGPGPMDGGDVSDATADGSTDAGGDAADAADVSDADDAIDATDVDDSDTGVPETCVCDTSEFCDEGCACDIACSAEVGPAPLGPDSVGLQRNEIAVFHPQTAGENITRVSLYDDASAGAIPRHSSLWTGAPEGLDLVPRTEDGLRPLPLSADVDDDGREEAIIVTSTAVYVADWDGVSVTYRSVYTYDEVDWFDAAAGDLDFDGGRVLVVSRQVDDVVTVDALGIGVTGDATRRATTSVTGVVRHAVAVAAPAAGERPLIHLVTTKPPVDYREPATLQQFQLGVDVLTETRSVVIEAFCGVGSGSQVPNDGIAVVAGDLTPLPGNELFIAAYCPENAGQPNLRAEVLDRDGVRRQWGRIGSEIVTDTYTSSGRVRPLVALGYFSAVPGDTSIPRYAAVSVAWNDWNGYPRVSTLSFHAGGQPDFSTGVGRLIETDGVVTGIAVRDLNGDGIDDLVTSSKHASGTRVIAWNADERLTAGVHTLEGSEGDASGPVLVVGDFDADSIRVRATGNTYRYTTGAYVNAVIAAPPTWDREDVRQASGSETTFGESTSESESHGGLLTYGGSISVGIGVSLYKVLELYGYLTSSFGVTHSWTFEDTTTYAQALTAGPEADLVAYSRAIYVSHEYEVVSHPEVEMIGERMTIDEVDSVVQATVSVERFLETIPNANLMVPPNLLAHTVGRPDTYDRPRTCNVDTLNARVVQGVVSAVYESPSLTDVGDAPGGYRTLSVDVETQTETGVDAVFEVGFEAGGALVVGGWVTGYVGGGYSYRKSVGSGATYTGSVGVISDGYGLDSRFQWGLCLFHWADRADGAHVASYPVITYVTQPY